MSNELLTTSAPTTPTAAELAVKIEALLFALGRPLTYTELAELLETEVGMIQEAITVLQKDSNRGVLVVDDGIQIELRAAGEAATLIEKVRKEEYSREIGRAGLEVLAAIMYREPLTRAEIDFIRGVNSSQTLRTLTMRGLVRRASKESLAGASGKFSTGKSPLVYEPTTELLATLGVAHVSELPDYASVRERLTALKQAYHATTQHEAEQTS